MIITVNFTKEQCLEWLAIHEGKMTLGEKELLNDSLKMFANSFKIVQDFALDNLRAIVRFVYNRNFKF